MQAKTRLFNVAFSRRFYWQA